MNDSYTKKMPELHPAYLQLLDSIDVGIHVVDLDGRSVIYNRRMAEMEDMPKEEVLNRNILDIFMFNSAEDSRLWQALQHGRSHRNEKQTYFNNKGLEITTVNDTFPLQLNTETFGAVEIARDITKLERMSRETGRRKDEAKFTFDQIIGKSDAIQTVITNAKRATRTSSSVLIYGETGTGKELFAQSIHNSSDRGSKPFISQNCAALPDSLIEGILFGSVKGGFTGATNHPGLFEQADGGTLMLDEINSLNPSLQAKLLRVIQEKSVRRIGDTKSKDVNVRIIATVNEDPITAVKNKSLREDLYYRLSVVTLMIPPLRDRKEDLPVLTDHFVNKFNDLFQLSVPYVAADVEEFFSSYEWPGNIRELEHVIEGAMNLISHDEPIGLDFLPLHMQNKASVSTASALDVPALQPNNDTIRPLQEYIESAEKHYIEEVLRRTEGNITQAASLLGIKRQSLQYRINKHRIGEQ
ncbi:sigma-54 interaction domain-containing protein [Salisediminibacterium halotolerans]|uniref:sigma-54 interaction domain-containing protein n=1 Tax=Salisediminibacterium halotolerans TaxID=517425 RepID=UPI000F106009|nr:sigma 54-interacting transcriptional regulator [Salisediminibacterium halotolerans]RLJ73284.1 arginine utilization regulatory protein [Actinophytocola xinjiangensis]RPE86706.1 arginine utilization regulatory protein [Salisediminibacterium halotolerans]TWG34081.1 arginine utilization regulatory protein [Salisediminibacterium halotolerans]GEL07595.1 arginine utilization regulatory protein RocR [Salisediminibacterium halotolerans]